MKKSTNPFLIILVAVALLSIIWEYLPEANSNDRLSILQNRASQLGADSIPLTPEEMETLGVAKAVKYRYHFGSKDWILIAIDGSRNSGVIHDPSYCLHGTGWVCDSKQSLPLQHGKAEIMKFTRDQESMTFAYWFDDGRSDFSSMFEYWLHRTARRITLGLSGDIPIMLFLYPEGDAPTPETWKAVADELIPKLLPEDTK